jgi:hypothetical protein
MTNQSTRQRERSIAPLHVVRCGRGFSQSLGGATRWLTLPACAGRAADGATRDPAKAGALVLGVQLHRAPGDARAHAGWAWRSGFHTITPALGGWLDSTPAAGRGAAVVIGVARVVSDRVARGNCPMPNDETRVESPGFGCAALAPAVMARTPPGRMEVPVRPEGWRSRSAMIVGSASCLTPRQTSPNVGESVAPEPDRLSRQPMRAPDPTALAATPRTLRVLRHLRAAADPQSR